MILDVFGGVYPKEIRKYQYWVMLNSIYNTEYCPALRVQQRWMQAEIEKAFWGKQRVWFNNTTPGKGEIIDQVSHRRKKPLFLN